MMEREGELCNRTMHTWTRVKETLKGLKSVGDSKYLNDSITSREGAYSGQGAYHSFLTNNRMFKTKLKEEIIRLNELCIHMAY